MVRPVILDIQKVGRVGGDGNLAGTVIYAGGIGAAGIVCAGFCSVLYTAAATVSAILAE